MSPAFAVPEGVLASLGHEALWAEVGVGQVASSVSVGSLSSHHTSSNELDKYSGVVGWQLVGQEQVPGLVEKDTLFDSLVVVSGLRSVAASLLFRGLE